MREVGTTVSCQRVVVDGRDGAGVDICALNQVVDEKEEQHSEGEGFVIVTPFIRERGLSGAEYTCGQ